MDSYINQMNNRIQEAPYGHAFVVSDFTDIMDYETAKKNIARIEKNGSLRRVIRGIYDRPSFSELLGEYAAPDLNEIALALARNYNWTIAPSGDTALNLLGLSTQVPAKWDYISTGPYRSYDIGKAQLQLPPFFFIYLCHDYFAFIVTKINCPFFFHGVYETF